MSVITKSVQVGNINVDLYYQVGCNVPHGFECTKANTTNVSGCGTRLTKGPKSHCDLEYRYVITCKAGHLQVQAFAVQDVGVEREIFKGCLENFILFASRADAA